MFGKSVIAAMAITLAPLGAHAQALVDASDPEVLAALIQDLGYKASIDVDSVGDPLIRSSAHGYKFNVFFYDCVENTECKAIQFKVGFDMEDGISLTRIQNFNQLKRWVNVYANEESNPQVEMDYNLRGGVSVENFNDTFDWWLVMMEEFIEYIDF
ncbi:MAG: YbjN domain-containing protein [Paracoccaceae bacterium]